MRKQLPPTRGRAPARTPSIAHWDQVWPRAHAEPFATESGAMARCAFEMITRRPWAPPDERSLRNNCLQHAPSRSAWAAGHTIVRARSFSHLPDPEAGDKIKIPKDDGAVAGPHFEPAAGSRRAALKVEGMVAPPPEASIHGPAKRRTVRWATPGEPDGSWGTARPRMRPVAAKYLSKNEQMRLVG